ncbi:polyprenyl diphosphate synthase [Thalassotalea marina]|uniref:Ditrans,polycis-undecaprenyl-diphosphate synthase ((2E,6E)-farnesyl-diphosphate specific) n=1 Tax=Thalassotalea marina TaxID=1673741 RepID=A0A919BNX8_9GAMM|nr:polyprenyl diphosphate synthase [Thalassotalea marina]GHG00972.1 ditrans,polycis-undecaprenyl-diphosphate synthase ((2E,6E)-farnesyl-diphosphate specific) [Thalassotalea marina]
MAEAITTDNSTEQTPQHVAIIMDGNGRWAQQRGKTRVVGHKNGVESVRAVVSTARKEGVKALTLFAFSSENWRRPEQEVSVLMDLFMLVLTREVRKLHKNGIRFQVIGDVSRFSEKLRKKINEAQTLTQDNTDMVLSVAANYGGRWDITNAATQVAAKVKSGELDLNQIDESVFDSYTSLGDLPDLDLLIRTGGDYRISNFLLWQAAYAEFYFTDILWPDFREDAFKTAINSFGNRERRFGQTGEQVQESR